MPPEIIQGEAATCGIVAMVAVAYIYQVNPRFTGWSEPVSWRADLAAQVWPIAPDPAPGARFLFSQSDLNRPEVRAIIRDRGPPIRRFSCVGDDLFAYP